MAVGVKAQQGSILYFRLFRVHRLRCRQGSSNLSTCITCMSPGSFSATLALIVIGAGMVLTAERRKLAQVPAC